MLDILVIAPHPDDAELGMGGAIAQWTKTGVQVGIIDLTTGEPTPYGDRETRVQETEVANQALGSPWRKNLGLPNRSLVADLEARRKITGVIRETRPRWLFAPYWEDAHPDHVAATELIEAARFWSKLSKSDLPGERHFPERIYYYYCVHLKLAYQPSFILDISDTWEQKIASIRAYESQFITGRPTEPPTFLDQLHHQAAYWGGLIGRKYGEPFATREPLALKSMRDLV
ncbi:1D-myo-inositol 2-acetamido-2-deoxy-alpha-D-glucopyranoside deacetylase [Planctomycetales bacterium 10988]|nr:1D-myo-inositol 2-acetamido-2-deoxy-alpha-D-glucopyranoside deacetylase [Planctomycetales bacterium 10988]